MDNMDINKDTQKERYQLTINNPQKYGLTHEKIKDILITNFKTLIYFCMADEMGTTYHTHIFVCFNSRVRFSTIKKHFGMAHIESVKGTVNDNIEYIKKSGKWENDIKHGTIVQGTYEEFGTPPSNSKGKNADMAELYDMILSGMSNAEILSVNQDFILHIDKLDKLRFTVLQEKYKNVRRLNLTCTYISGVTGSGKTRYVLDKYGDANVFRVTDYQHPFDGYNCQQVLMYDEFRDSLKLKEMLLYNDIYPIELPARFSNKFACYEKIYIVSNWDLEKQYSDLQLTDKESWDAFLRRINDVLVFDTDKVTHYNSVKEYMNRIPDFEKPNSSEQLLIDELFNNEEDKGE